ncbi:tetratricopeptide repeat protein [Roseateles oligotrophus]|uniref:Tetratricopeptide repeat protein n=1 Tax=Roseateles oligotrophus TaxID=1769250 RepID=A0ABT2YHJ8_9BURK|nr:tetratricopeptide repeat protein [Roseateles oligotrophus]MCV2369536.1 tetratricopeptide repeat protein [Roseateles oligotrophus]
MIDITLQNFESELIAGSMQQPMLLDIWAPWCGPCRTLGPLLEKLEVAYAGRFKLAKVNADEVPEISTQLSQMFGVRSIPFCVMFVGGQPVDGFVGAVPEAQIREFLDKHVPPGEVLEAQEEVAEAEDLMAEGDLEAALVKLQSALESDPANEAARFDYVKALLELGLLAEAKAAFEPVAAKAVDTITPHARFAALGHWLAACERAAAGLDVGALQACIAANKRDFDARYALAQGLFASQSYTEAMDELLEIIMRDKAWNNGLARKSYIAILELMSKPAPKSATAETKGTLELAGQAAVVPRDPLLDQYRRKLSMALN